MYIPAAEVRLMYRIKTQIIQIGTPLKLCKCSMIPCVLLAATRSIEALYLATIVYIPRELVLFIQLIVRVQKPNFGAFKIEKNCLSEINIGLAYIMGFNNCLLI